MIHTKKFFIIALLFLLSGCYGSISGKVVDAVTGNPLEGAVVLAQWTKTHGLPGLTSHSIYKIEETETDKDGKFSLSGVYSPFVDRPEMVIFKKGYIPWRNDMNFQEMKKYKKVVWQDDLTYKLEHLKEGYSKLRLDMFVSTGIIGADFKVTPKFSNIQKELSKESQLEIDAKKINLNK